MCNYCGCRDFPVIGALSAEHVEIEETAGLLRRAVEAGDHDAAHRHLAELTGLLTPHVDREERGLFSELAADETLGPTIRELCAEHGDLHAALRPPRPDRPDWGPVLAAVERLREHIDKEEHGVFPAAVIVLPMPAWERVDAAVG